MTIGLSLLIVSGLLHPIVKVVQENHDGAALSMDGLSEELRAFGEHHMENGGISDSLDGEGLGFPKGMKWI